MATRGVVGVTTNPTIFASALAQGDAYDAQLADLAAAGTDDAAVEAAVERITTDDVRTAADLLRPVYDATDGVDGRVSIEVDPRLAHDADATVVTAERLWRTIDRPNVYIKIPATVAGRRDHAHARAGHQRQRDPHLLPRALPRRHGGVRDRAGAGARRRRRPRARGLGRLVLRLARGHRRGRRASKVGTPEALDLRGQTAVANARLAFEAYEEFRQTDRWRSLAASGAQPQRPLWASTGVKNPEYRDTMYVDELVTDGVVNTMPEATLQAFADHGVVTGDTITGTASASRRTIETVESFGVSLVEVTDRLEAEGVRKFEDSWTELLATTRDNLRRLASS